MSETCYYYGLQIVVQKNTRRNSKTFVMSDQGGIDVINDFNGREEMVSIRCLGKAIYGSFWRQGEIRWRVQVGDIEGRIIYQRSRFEGGLSS